MKHLSRSAVSAQRAQASGMAAHAATSGERCPVCSGWLTITRKIVPAGGGLGPIVRECRGMARVVGAGCGYEGDTSDLAALVEASGVVPGDVR